VTWRCRRAGASGHQRRRGLVRDPAQVGREAGQHRHGDDLRTCTDAAAGSPPPLRHSVRACTSRAAATSTVCSTLPCHRYVDSTSGSALTQRQAVLDQGHGDPSGGSSSGSWSEREELQQARRHLFVTRNERSLGKSRFRGRFSRSRRPAQSPPFTAPLQCGFEVVARGERDVDMDLVEQPPSDHAGCERRRRCAHHVQPRPAAICDSVPRCCATSSRGAKPLARYSAEK